MTLDDTTKPYYRNDLLKSCYDMTNILLINLIRLLQIYDIKDNSDIYSKISVFNTYFKLGFDEFYILNKEFDKANKNYDNRMMMYDSLGPIVQSNRQMVNINEVQMHRMTGLTEFFKDYNYKPSHVDNPYHFGINSGEYLAYITDAAIRSTCNLGYIQSSSVEVISCINPLVYSYRPGYSYNSRIFNSKFERETSIIS
jgi:hypothetical protein